MYDYDLIVLGGGPGGYTAALRAARRGRRVLLVEQDRPGGTCLNRGCIPTKALLHGAKLYQDALRGAELGVTAERLSLDFGRLARHRDKIVQKLGAGVEALLSSAGVKAVRERGELWGKNEVRAGGRTYTAGSVLLATGSSPSLPPIPGVDARGVLTSDGVLALQEAPGSVVIVGGGVIGMEFASLFSMLNIPVVVLEATPDLLGAFDRDTVRPVERALRRNGAELHTGAKVLSIEEDSPMTVRFEKDGSVHTARGEIVVMAAGRRPCTRDIGLERAGVQTDAKGYVPVDGGLCTNVPGVYAVGDITGKQQLAHVASAQGIVAADNVCGLNRTLRYDAVPSCVYTVPELASVGLTEREARERGYAVKTGSFPAAANGRSLILGDTGGITRLVTDAANGELLGAHICSPIATETIGQIACAMGMEGTVEELAEIIQPHPTVGEMLTEAAHDVEGLCCNKPLGGRRNEA